MSESSEFMFFISYYARVASPPPPQLQFFYV
jgi:hypothetical protein